MLDTLCINELDENNKLIKKRQQQNKVLMLFDLGCKRHSWGTYAILDIYA